MAQTISFGHHLSFHQPSTLKRPGMKTNQMNGLYPIIRRVRRPLIVAAEPPGSAGTQPEGQKAGAQQEVAGVAKQTDAVAKPALEEERKPARQEGQGETGA